MGTASSLPVAVFLEKDQGLYHVFGSRIPRDGGYELDLPAIFPPQVIEQMCFNDANCYNLRSANLEEEALRKAAEYFGISR